MLGQNYTHANFSVDDLAAAKQFYVDTLGFSVKAETDYDIMLESDKGTRLNLYYKPDHKAWDSTVFGVEVDDVGAAVDELKAAGISMEKLDGTDEKGILSDADRGEIAWFKDPAGNWLCVSHAS